VNGAKEMTMQMNEPQRAIALVRCPKCGAAPGQHCRLPLGQRATTHFARMALLRKQETGTRKSAAAK
jgi:hypothetical protein